MQKEQEMTIARANKSVIEIRLSEINTAVLVGEIQATEGFAILKQLEEYSKKLKSELLEQTIDELSTYAEKEWRVSNCTLSLRNSAGRWDYSHIPEIVKMEQELKLLKEKHKLAYKSQQQGHTSVTDDGEVIVPATFISGKETIAVKIDK